MNISNVLLILMLLGSSAPSTGERTVTQYWTARVSLEISLPSTQFLLGEPVWLDVTLTNTSQDTIVIPHGPLCLRCRTLDLELRDESGDLVPYSGSNVFWIAKPVSMAPGESKERSYDLLEFYGTRVNECSSIERRLQPGSYSVTAREGSVYSTVEPFRIVQPEGTDSEVLNALHEASVSLDGLELDEALRVLESIEHLTASSPYAERATYLKALSRLGNPEALVQACNDAIESDPDSRYAGYYVGKVVGEMTPVELALFMEGLERSAPNSRAAKAARKIARKIANRALAPE